MSAHGFLHPAVAFPESTALPPADPAVYAAGREDGAIAPDESAGDVHGRVVSPSFGPEPRLDASRSDLALPPSDTARPAAAYSASTVESRPGIPRSETVTPSSAMDRPVTIPLQSPAVTTESCPDVPRSSAVPLSPAVNRPVVVPVPVPSRPAEYVPAPAARPVGIRSAMAPDFSMDSPFAPRRTTNGNLRAGTGLYGVEAVPPHAESSRESDDFSDGNEWGDAFGEAGSDENPDPRYRAGDAGDFSPSPADLSTDESPDQNGTERLSTSREGAGVTLERNFKFSAYGTRRRATLPPMPRDDPAPEAVTPRERGRGENGRFRRNPAVGEALAELSRPAEEPSAAERAAARLRAKRPAKAGSALRLPSPGDERQSFTPQQRLLLLDTWTRSGLPAGDFAAMVGMSKHTLYLWKKHFEESGPAGLEDQARGGPGGSRMSEVTKRAILMLKQSHPEYGCERISDMLARGPALPASAGAVAKVLKEAGYEAVERPTERHPDKIRHFERARTNSLWQTDLFTFVLKRQNRRLHLVAFMDDHSRFLTGWGLFSSPSTEMVIETLKSAVASYQAPAELLTDNGPQYVTWRGHSKFSTACTDLGIKQIVARPRRPQTLGKVERFWGTLWREFLGAAIFVNSADAHARIGGFIDGYNFERPHQSLGGLTPADRYLDDAREVKAEMSRRMSENAARLARGEAPVAAEGRGLLTPSYFPGESEVVDAEPRPGADPLTAGLTAAAGMEGEDHDRY